MKSHTTKTTEAGRLESPANNRILGYVRVMELPNGLGGVDLAIYDDAEGRKTMACDPDFTPLSEMDGGDIGIGG